jgi:Flp pilus assembly protein TadD
MDSTDRCRPRWPHILVCLVLAGSVFLTFWPATRYEFVNFDDLGYIIQNRHVQHGLNWDDIHWAFTSFYAGNWHPLTWLSHTLDWQLFGPKPGGHHLTNIILHAANTLLLFWVLLGMTEGRKAPNTRIHAPEKLQTSSSNEGRTLLPCALVAGLFGLHPMHVESVAWIAERKDVLSTFFFLLTILTYAKYVAAKAQISKSSIQHPASVRHSSFVIRHSATVFYLLSLVLFACGLMSKPMLVTTPFVLLLLDFWPLARWQPLPFNLQLATLRKLVFEKLPFFALSAADCVLTFLAQSSTGAVASNIVADPATRVFNSTISYAAYLGKMFWPGDMAVYYPFREHPDPRAILAGIAVLLLGSAIVIRYFRARPYLAFGWFWFVGTLVPVIGLVQVGLQSMADRYTYIPYIGLFVALVWLCGDLLSRLPWSVGALWIAGAGLLFGCGLSARHQLRFWQTSATLWAQAVRVTSGNVVARQNLGSALVEQRRFEEAAQQFQEALKIKPMYAEAENNYGFALSMLGKTDEALEHYQRAVAMKPIGRTHYLIATALLNQGKHAEAAAEYMQAIELEPELPPALNDLAWIMAADTDPSLRNGPQAVILAERACEASLEPDPQFIGTLAAAYAEAGRFQEAISAAERAKELAIEQGKPEIAQRNEELLQYYRKGQAYHEPRAEVK